jgi:protein BCP1
MVQFSLHSLDYKFTNQESESRDKESFGLDVRGRMMLISMDRFEEMVNRMGQVYAA